MSQVSIQDLGYRGRLSSRTKSLRIELSFCWWWVCSFGLVWVRLRFIYSSRSLHFVKNHRFDPTSKKFPIDPILFNSAKSVTSLWMSSCIPNNPSTRLWLLTLAGWVRNLTKITSNGFPKAVGDGFWPSWGGLLGHLSVQRPPGQKQTPKVWKLDAPWGTQRNPKMTVFPWKPNKNKKKELREWMLQKLSIFKGFCLDFDAFYEGLEMKKTVKTM